MVLAREGAAAVGDLRYYADVKGDSFATPIAAAQLGAALASYGDQTRADAMFARAAAMLNTLPEVEPTQIFRADYGTNFRDAAALLTLAVEAGSQAVDREALTDPARCPRGHAVHPGSDLGAARGPCADRPPPAPRASRSTASPPRARWSACWTAPPPRPSR